MFLVKYEYAPRRFAFGQLDDESPRKGTVSVRWITRRRHLPKVIDFVKLIEGGPAKASGYKRPVATANSMEGPRDGR